MAPRLKMSTCGVCNHKDRARIEALRVGGASLVAIGKQFDLSKD